MPAFEYEYELAKLDGIRFHWHVQAMRIQGTGAVEAIACLNAEGRHFELACDLVIPSIGQSRLVDFLARVRGVEFADGRVQIHRETGQTANPKYFAGGDCVNGGREVVDAVADGKRAAIGIVEHMADLTTHVRGQIRCPNPFWLASRRPPTAASRSCARSTPAGAAPSGRPSASRSSTSLRATRSVDWNGQRMMGLNNIELITRPADRSQPARDRRGEEALPEARRDRVADGGVASARPGTTSCSAPKTPAPTAWS